jgi:SAM-dependent methyltransferase
MRNKLGWVESDEKLVSDSQAYWEKPETDAQRYNSHWRGHGVFAGDDARWLAVGAEHRRLFEVFARGVELSVPMGRVIEWGCGGGANAVHFGPLTREFVGVDLNPESLDECGRQLVQASPDTQYRPVQIAADTPESAVPGLERSCDLFLCVYVFELLPTQAYARRVLEIARQVLRPGGMAMIQIKYRTADIRTAPRRWNYVQNLAHNTTYGIDEFWQLCDGMGLTPRLVSLVPKQTLVDDERYAYFALTAV